MESGSKIGGRNPVAVHDLRSHLPIADLELWSVIAGISGFDDYPDARGSHLFVSRIQKVSPNVCFYRYWRAIGVN